MMSCSSKELLTWIMESDHMMLNTVGHMLFHIKSVICHIRVENENKDMSGLLSQINLQ